MCKQWPEMELAAEGLLVVWNEWICSWLLNEAFVVRTHGTILIIWTPPVPTMVAEDWEPRNEK